MVNVLDSLVGNLTAALTTKGMMKNLVFVYSVHNYAPALPSRLFPTMLPQYDTLHTRTFSNWSNA